MPIRVYKTIIKYLLIKDRPRTFYIARTVLVGLLLALLAHPAHAATTEAQFTVSAWVNPQDSTGAGTTASKAILVKNEEIRLVTDPDSKPLCQVHNGTSWQTAATSDTALSTNQWTHVACTYDRSYLKVYVNAVQTDSDSLSVDINNTANSWLTGEDAAGTYGDFDGLIDEVKIFNYGLTAREVREEYNAASALRLGDGGSVTGRSGGGLEDGLVGWWKMDESAWDGTSGEVVDSSGNGNHGTGYGGVTTAAGRFGNGGSFDGVDDYVEVGNNSTLENLPRLTISTWVYLTDNGVYRGIVTKGTNLVFQNPSYRNDTIKMYRLTTGQTATTIPTQGSVPRNQWNHVVATYDDFGDRKWHVYVNGSKPSYETHQAATGTLASDAASSLNLGSLNDDQPLNGKMDDTRIYNRALSASEISELYSYGPPPVAHWTFDENTGTTASDVSGNGNDGTLGGDGLGTDVPAWTGLGRFGNALEFDGESYVTTASSVTFKAFTVEAWIYPTEYPSYNKIVDGYSGGFRFNTISDTGKIGIDASGGNNYGTMPKSNSAIPLNTWTHVAGVYDGINEYIVINGIRQNETRTAFPGVTLTGTYSIGKGSSAIENWRGNIDDIRIYNYARTQKQILQDMYGDTPGPHPIAKYSFDEGTGQVVDSSHGDKLKMTDSDLQGTLGSSATDTTGDPDWVTTESSCVSGTCLDFTAANSDYVDVGDIGIDVNSVCAWVNMDSTTESILDLDAAASYVSASAGTLSATGFTSPTVYVNGVETTTIGTGWQHVCVTTDTAIDANDVDLGVVGATYLDGSLDEVYFFNYALSADEVKVLYTRGATRFD